MATREVLTYYFHQPEWPLFFSRAEDIQEYLERVVDVFGLRKYIHFNAKIAGSYWDEESGKWTVQIAETLPDGQVREFEDTCDVLLQCTGVLSRPKMPNIEGLETFKGKASLSLTYYILSITHQTELGPSYWSMGQRLQAGKVAA